MPDSAAAPAPDHARILRLEERLAWFEKHVVEQDRAMLELAEQVSRLKAELRSVRDKAEHAGSGGEEEKEAPPPHY